MTDMPEWKRKLLEVGIFFFTMAAACVVVIWGGKFIGEANVSLVFIMAVVVIARFTRGKIPGILASLLSTLLMFLRIDPIHNAPRFWGSGLLVTLAGTLITSVLVSTMTARVKQEASTAWAKEKTTKTMFHFTRDLLITRGFDNIARVAAGFFREYFQCTVYMYIGDPVRGNAIVDSPDSFHRCSPVPPVEAAAAADAFRLRVLTGNGTEHIASAGATFFPILSSSGPIGVLGLYLPAEAVHAEETKSAIIMALTSITLALERQELSDRQRDILSEAEEEKMRSNLLRAISHDLRTPLTGILGASESILQSGEEVDTVLCLHFTRYIHEDAQWLLRMVENLLSITRIRGDGAAAVQKNPEAVEEVVGEAVQRIRKRYPDVALHASIPEELLIVPMDATLIEQVLMNMVQNSLTHSGSKEPVVIQVYQRDNAAVFRVIDMGKGLGENPLSVFDTRHNGNTSDSQRGMGIGLSICRTIVKAHGGHIAAANHSKGGALFVFNLPMEGDLCDDIQPVDLSY